MSIDEHNIDRLFSKKLDGHTSQEAPSAADMWARMESRLDAKAEGGDEKVWLWWPRMAVAASMVGLLGLGYMLYQPSAADQPMMAAKAPATAPAQAADNKDTAATMPLRAAQAMPGNQEMMAMQAEAAPAKEAAQPAAKLAEPRAARARRAKKAQPALAAPAEASQLAAATARQDEEVMPSVTPRRGQRSYPLGGVQPETQATTIAYGGRPKASQQNYGTMPVPDLKELARQNQVLLQNAQQQAQMNQTLAANTETPAYRESESEEEMNLEPVLIEIRTDNGKVMAGAMRANMVRRLKNWKEKVVQTESDRVNSGQIIGQFASYKNKNKKK